MAKLFSTSLLRNKLGQGVVEYILLLAVITSLGYTFYNNRRFKEFMRGRDGMFATMKKGMSYSYRYGLEYTQEVDVEEKSSFDYRSNKHDTYFNPQDNKSRFFSGIQPYP